MWVPFIGVSTALFALAHLQVYVPSDCDVYIAHAEVQFNWQIIFTLL